MQPTTISSPSGPAAGQIRSLLSTKVTRFLEYKETARRIIILTLLFLLPACLLRPGINETDFWWHLTTAKWIVEHGTLPSTDPFSAYGAGKSWVAYSWLFELLIYGLYQAFGLFGIILYQLLGTLAISVAVYGFVAKREPRFVVAVGLAALAIIAIIRNFSPRPWLFTILFFTITLDVVLRLREGSGNKAVWGLPLLYVLWANLHIQFVYGLILLGLACLAPILDRLIGEHYPEGDARRLGSSAWWRTIGLTVACALSTLVNPHHIQLYRIIVELGGQTGMWQYTQEFQSLSFRSFEDWVLLGLTFAGAMTLGKQGRRSSFEYLLFIVAIFLSFRAMRDAWFIVLTALAVLVPAVRTRAFGLQSQFVLTRARLAMISGLAIGCMTLILIVRDFSAEHIRLETGKNFPMSAAEFVKENKYPGPLYNHFDWGGYLIWRLPHLQVSMDGRANVHGDQRIWKSLATWNGGRDWASDPELSAARLVIASRDMALASLLHLDKRFTEVYRDETAVVFVRAVQESSHPKLPDASAEIASVN
jgi:hypothetical protein